MTNQSDSASSTGPTLSQVPPIRSFEFDKKAIGHVKTGVNQFRGSVALPMDLLVLPGRPGLDVKLTAVYSSAVHNTVTTWNVEAPTGILGLGWDMPIETIMVDKAGSGTTTSDTYYLVSGGSANPMVKTGETAGRWTFQLRNYEFWSIQYDPGERLWTVVKEDGSTYRYGGSEPSAIQWGVKWGNWIGSSTEPSGQGRYPVAWNLVSITSTWGHRVRYAYASVERAVGSDGLTFTQASYLHSVTDSFDRKLTFNYGDKYGALNPSPRNIIEYQARNDSEHSPNAYQDKYETRFLDSVDLADSAGKLLYSIHFEYDFINMAPTGARNHPLMWKRCLKSFFQHSPNGEVLPAMEFAYFDQPNDVSAGALKSITYPTGGCANYQYKKNILYAPKSIDVANPLSGSVPGVWHGSDYVVLTYCAPTSSRGIRAMVYSWSGSWIAFDATSGAMPSTRVDPDSVQVLAQADFIALSFRNLDDNSDELYLFRRDAAQFGKWELYNDAPFLLRLSGTPKPSRIIAGSDFVIAHNKDYSSGPFQGFSWDWKSSAWTTPWVLPTSDLGADGIAIAAVENYWIAAFYHSAQRRGQFQIFYRDLAGAWEQSQDWTNTDLDVVIADGQFLFTWTPQPSYAIATYVRATTNDRIDYSLRIFQWDENFYVPGSDKPPVYDLQSSVQQGVSQFEIFQTVAIGATVANNRLVLRNVGGDLDQAPDQVWMDQRFAMPSPDATVALASGEDVAVMCVSDGSQQTNTLMTFDPDVLASPWTTSKNIDQKGRRATVSNGYMTVGRFIYLRDAEGNWQELDTQLNGLGDEDSVQNRGPHYVAYQDSDGTSARSYVAFLGNGDAETSAELYGGPQKIYVPASERTPGMILAGPRFLVSYPSATSFKRATQLTLTNLDEADMADHVYDFPVAVIRIDDPFEPSHSFVQSYFYANSEQSEISYNSATGVAQYPLVYVVPAVASTDSMPPNVQPEGRSQFYYSNGLSPQQSLNYPQGWLYNYAAVLNGMLLSRQDFDSDGKLVAAQLNYWEIYRNDVNTGSDLYGAWARLVRTTNTSDGLTQDTYSLFDQRTGVELWREQSYVDADGNDWLQRTQSLYAWQVPEYAPTFLALHDYGSVAQATTSVSDAKRDERTRVYTRSEVTTYRNWAAGPVTIACMDPSTCRLAPYQTYGWTTPGTAAPSFDFATDGHHAGWVLGREVQKRSSPAGLVEQQVAWNGVPSSFVYDRFQRCLIGKFPNASRTGDEASYTGFEDYEVDEGWQRGAGAIVVPNTTYPQVDAHLGERSVRLQPATAGAAGLRRVFRPQRQNQRYVFSAWVKLPEGFDATKGQARWHIVVAGGATLDLAFPSVVGRWAYASQAIDLPVAAAAVEITGENANTQSHVLVDDLRFSPVSCAFEAKGYDPRFWVANASLGANGETSRMVYDVFQQPVFTTNPGDALARLQASYLSRSSNQAGFAAIDPNAELELRAAGQGVLTSFTRGNEWQSLWVAQSGTWEVVGATLTQTSAGRAGTLAIADPQYRSDYVVAVQFQPSEAVTQPAGLRIGNAVTVQWDPDQAAWELNDGSGARLAPPVSGARFEFSHGAPLAAGKAGDLVEHFRAGGRPLAADATVAATGPGHWIVTDPGGACYELVQKGTVIKVAPLGWRWFALVGARSFVFWVDGRRIFSYHAPTAFDAAPEFFFGTRVAVSHLAAGTRPQASVSYEDANGIAIQLQQFIDDRAVVSQTIPDDLGRAAVRTKAAYVEAARNPLLAYCGDFADFDWATGKMSGLVAQAYPDDDGYPYSREVYEASPLGRVLEQGMPGEQFRVGAHATAISYGTTVMRIGANAATYSRTTIVNPNGDATYQVSNQLAQVLCKVSQNGEGELRNVTIFDPAGNPTELRAPNYYALPAGSSVSDWVTAQAFDYAGQPISITPGKLGATGYIYDPAGNLRFAQDPQGAQDGYFTYCKYDAISRPTESGYITGAWNRADLQRIADSDASWPPTPSTWRKKFTYDDTDPAHCGLGRTHEAFANNADAGTADVIESFTYMPSGSVASQGLRVPEFDGAADNRVDYRYDNLGNITRITYPPVDGSRLDVHYRNNALNQVAAIDEIGDFKAPLAAFAYAANGRMETRTLALAGGAATTVERYTLNSPLWVARLRAEKPSGESVFEEALTYTEGGFKGAAYFDGTVASASYHIAGATPQDYQFKYSYSDVGQVQNAQTPANSDWDLGVVAPVAYDANGNFTSAAQGGTPRRYGYNPGTDQLAKIENVTGGATVAECTYNKNGDAITLATERFGAVGVHRLGITYDRGTRMTTHVVDAAAGGSTLDFIYGGGNERILKRVTPSAGAVTRKLYVRGTNAYPLCELVRADGAGGIAAAQYIFGPGGVVALRRDGARYGVLRDHLGSVRAVVDAQAAVVASYDYLTFGTPAAAHEPSPGFMPYLFTGQEFDWEIGLYNYRARLYSGSLGRFLATDPSRQFFSPYIYASNNPVLYIDPSGQWSIGSIFSAIGGFIIGVVEILAGVVVDVVAGVVEALSLGAATPLSIALAMTAGALYGAGTSAIAYSVFNAGDFSWKEYGIEMGIGALAGFLTAGFGELGAIAAEAATGVKAAVEAGEQVSRLARAGSFVIENGITIAGGAATEVLTTTLRDVAAGVTPGADLADAAMWSVIGSVTDLVVPGAPDYKAGWGNLGKRALVSVGRAEALGVAFNTVNNLVAGNPWDQGLVNTVFGGALNGSLGALQVKAASRDATAQIMRMSFAV